MEIIEPEEQKEKRLKKSEQRLSVLWDTVKQTNIHTGVSQKEREKEEDRLFEEIMPENPPHVMKGMNINIQATQ